MNVDSTEETSRDVTLPDDDFFIEVFDQEDYVAKYCI